MSTETERKLGHLLDSSQVTIDLGNTSSTSSQSSKGSSSAAELVKPIQVSQSDIVKEKLNHELKRKQEKIKVICLPCQYERGAHCFI